MARGNGKLTKAEARAIGFLLDLAWADYDAMTDGDLKTYKLNKRWLDAAQRGTDKVKRLREAGRGRRSGRPPAK
jgi:hypothetical protein